MCTSTRSAGSAARASEDSSPVYFAATPEANMTPDQPWIFRTYAGYATPRQTNERFRANLAKGQTGLSIAFDLPTQCGYDADHPMSRGEVGRVGVPVGDLGDMGALLEGIPLAEMNTSMTINATAVWLLALYVAVAEEQGADPSALSGTTQNDILKEYLSRGTYAFPPGPSMRLTADLVTWTLRDVQGPGHGQALGSDLPGAVRRRGPGAPPVPVRRAGELARPHRGAAGEQRLPDLPRDAGGGAVERNPGPGRPAPGVERGSGPSPVVGPAVVAPGPADPGVRVRPPRARRPVPRLDGGRGADRPDRGRGLGGDRPAGRGGAGRRAGEVASGA